MIRYAVTERRLRHLIKERKSNWLDKAEQATTRLKAAGAFSDIGPEWGNIKPVYMDLQHNKCGFCERLLPPEEFGRGEHDVEHFRPKRQAVKWPPRSRTDLNYSFATGAAYPNGYYWLAYDPLNYLTACKTYNSNRKRDYFPIAGVRGLAHAAARELLQQEKPFLIYPLGSIDQKPEELIGFVGILPVPKASRGHRKNRAEITIDFFSLDLREELLRQRFGVIARLIGHLENRESSNAQRRQRANRRIDEIIADDAEHANCARSYLDLFEEDPQLAYDCYSQGERIIAEIRRLQ